MISLFDEDIRNVSKYNDVTKSYNVHKAKLTGDFPLKDYIKY